MIRLFIFDMGGVLVRNFNILPEAAKILGMSYPVLLNYIHEDLTTLMEGSLSVEEFWIRFNSKSGFAVKRELWSELFNPVLDRSTEKFIERLKEKCRVVCGTNTIVDHYNFHQKRGDYKVFDTVYASHLMGIVKPDPEFYQWILDREGVCPEETVFTDDFPENIEIARDLGIHSFLFKDADSFEKEFNSANLKIQSY